VEIGRYADVLRAHWVLLVSSILVCTVGAGALAWTGTPTYAATTQLFVSTGDLVRDVGQSYEGGLYAQQRARSYAKIVVGQREAQAVIEQLGLAQTVDSVQKRIRASVPPDSVVINVTVRDRSPGLAKSIADSLGDQLPALVDRLEAERGQPSPVQLTVTRPARLPASPVSPRKPIYLALGALIGFAVGVGGAVLRSALDRRIRSPAEASLTARAPVLGRIAEHSNQGISPVILADPLSAGADGYRGLRANLSAVSAEHDLRSFVVSSAVAGEGKTEVVANLGIALAQVGERVVVVDANLRSPRLGELLGVSGTGLTDLIAASLRIEPTETASELSFPDRVLLALRWHPTVPLAVLGSGSARPNPSELLDSETFYRVLHALTERFDFVIVDTPALLPVADAAVLARRASAVILVARAASTNTDELKAARHALRAVDRPALGVVLNRVRKRDSRLYREDPLPPRRTRSRAVALVRSDRKESSEWLF
jgi:polysaccharide biosynthesis transport protein